MTTSDAPPPGPARPLALPPHKCSLTLEHNDHRNYYQSLADYLKDVEARGGTEPDWESPEARQRAIDTDEYWTLQWYPNTPVGFNHVAAPTLEECLALANADD